MDNHYAVKVLKDKNGACNHTIFRDILTEITERSTQMEKVLPHRHDHTEETEKLSTNLEHIEDFQKVADVFKQLSDSSRVRIFWLLCHCEECVINISSLVDMSSPAVSHHLRQLKSGGLIVSRREGKEVYYKAAETEESMLLHKMIEKTMEMTCPQG